MSQPDAKPGLGIGSGSGRWRGGAAALTAIALASLPLAAGAQDLTSFRAPNQLEQAYVALAADLHEPALCQRISANALYRVRKPVLVRSRCFYVLAISTRNAAWCDQVSAIPAGVGVMNWLDPERCRYQVTRLAHATSRFPIRFDVETVLRQAGYTPQQLLPSFVRGDEADWPGFYAYLRDQAEGSAGRELRRRLALLPDFSRNERAEDQPLYYTERERERENNWLTARSQRLCIQGRLAADCGESFAAGRPDIREIVRTASQGAGEVLSQPSPDADPSPYRYPSELEKAVYDTAVRRRDAALCQEIREAAIVVGWSLEPGLLFLTLRSGCLLAVAASSQDDAPCDQVHPLAREDLEGYGVTPDLCRRMARGRIEPIHPMTLRPDWRRVLRDLGYAVATGNDATAHATADNEDPSRWLALADDLTDPVAPGHEAYLLRLRSAAARMAARPDLNLSEAELRRHFYRLSVVRFHCSINRYGDRYRYNGYSVSPPTRFGGRFELIDHTGRSVTDEDFRGRYLLVYFGYTSCPDVCPTSLVTMVEALHRLGASGRVVQPLFISVDPTRDTPEQLAAYVPLFDPRLIGLTGSPAQLRRAANRYQASYFAGEIDGDYVVDHTSWTYLVAPDGRPLLSFDHGTKADAMAAAMAAVLQGDRSLVLETKESNEKHLPVSVVGKNRYEDF